MQAAQIYQEPEKLTVAKLKTELTKHGVPFPKTARKAEYVGLYRDRVQNNSGFSSDEDIIDIRARSNKVTVLLQKLLDDSMTISGTDIRELSDDELRLQLRKRGFDIGPIMKTTRSVYEKKLERALKNAESGDAGLEYSDEDSHSEEDEEEEEEPEPVVVETRRTRRSMLQRDEKGGSATRRRGMQTRDEAVQHEEPEEKETPKPPPVPVQTKQETLRPARRWVPVWMQILIVIFIALLVYLVAKTMEENPAKMIPRS